MKKKLFISFLFMFLFASSALSAKDVYKFRTLSPEGGFYYDGVLSIQQDKSGFMWVLMPHDLCRFDGYKYKSYNQRFAEMNHTVDSIFYTMEIDKTGRFFVNTNNNVLYLYDAFNAKQKSKNTTEIHMLLQKVTTWQMDHFSYSKEGNLHDNGIDAWTNGVLYLGMSEWAKIADNKEAVYEWLRGIGDTNEWKIPANFKNHPKYQLYHGDELCVAQFYLNMYEVYKEEKMLTATQERIEWIIKNPGDSSMHYRNKQVWSWCDALFMAPPVYAHLAVKRNNPIYLSYMDRHYKATYNHLYDKEKKLFFRDDSYFNKREENGEKIFWGRGNGWVAAGLVSLLKQLPHDSEYRPFYEKLFVELVSNLAALQNRDGFWHASLLDPAAYPSPETSATAMITFALAYGINSGLLDATKYYPHTIKAWDALLSAVDGEGKLGWVQPIGADPKKVTRDMTAVYGVGAFLLAGTEIYKLTK